MRSIIYVTVVLFLPLGAGILAQKQNTADLSAVQEAYKAAIDNVRSGSGAGGYEVYTVPPGPGSKQELLVKAKVKVFFDHEKFNIRLDYEKDNVQHLDSRIIIYDGTAILVNRMSKRILPSHSEGDVFEAKPLLSVMRQAGFDYNPCWLPTEILPVRELPKYALGLTVATAVNMDYTGSFENPPGIRCTFLASKTSGYNITLYREFYLRHNNFQHVIRHATWDRKKDIWYVKAIDNQWLPVNGTGERIVFQYSTFEPNPDISPSLFNFDALSLSPKARLIDRRPNAEQPVLHQSPSSKIDAAKLDKLADAVKTLTPASAKPHPPRSSSPHSLKRRRYALLASGAFLCIFGILLIWRRIRARKRNSTPNP